MDNNLLKEALEIFAYKMMDKYFEKPTSNRYWREQLNIEFTSDFCIWFGHLYHNGGEGVKIYWDLNLNFRLKTFHLTEDISTMIHKEFTNFIDTFKNE
ncbi:hypothetical protein ACQVSN_07025 [Bacillus mobilis]|uniref:hypothetical protein n=1 Tax=Bacillus mobilis TaxID=2026190 RepID=UPI0021D00C9B|nr:hypothetical protein [Bacillus mobilis]MCU5198030.1 hypothetical protein [Bacillus mobilis]